MANDPILDAITGSGVAVADDDPILSVIRAGSGSPKRKAAPATSEAENPIMSAITGTSAPVVPFDTVQNPAGSPTERASKVGRTTVPLGPPKNLFVDTKQIPRNPFTNQLEPAPPMATEEEKARWRAGLSDEQRQQLADFEERQAAEGTIDYEGVVKRQGLKHLGQNIKDIAGDVLGYGPKADPSQSLIDVTGFVPPEKRRERPIATGITQAITGLGTPESAALLAGTAGAGALPALARAGISAYFAAQMAQGAYDQVPGIKEAWARGDIPEVKRLATLAGVNVLMGAVAGAHGLRESGLVPRVGPEPIVPKGTISEPLARDEAAASMGAGKPQTVGAGEANVPEKPETLNAQVDFLKKGTNKVVYFPKGTVSLPEPPENAKVTVVPGNKPGAGTYYHADEITPAQIKNAVKDGTYGELLGNVQTKEEAAQGQPAAIVARDEKGTEQKASVVDASNPEAVTKQAQTLQDQFPQATISQEAPESVVAGRQAPTPTPAEKPAQPEVSRETPIPQERRQPQNAELRQRVSEMTPEQMRSELLTSRTTGLPNRRAFDEAGKAGAVAMSDADGLKALNDKFGYEAGNELLKAKADALKEAGLEAYYDKGDEFLYRGESPEDLTAKLDKAREIVRNKIIEATMTDGTVRRFKGADFSYGTGKDLAEAETGLKSHKSERESRGVRGITETQPETGQVNQGGEAQAAQSRIAEAAQPSERTAETPAVAASETAEHAETAQAAKAESKALESTHPEPGDIVQITGGKLKGKTGKVTRFTEEGGVYVRTDENSRVRYVKAGDFEAQAKPSFEIGARDDLLAPNEGEALGTRYSGLSPAALKKLLPESVREKLDTEVAANQRARGLQGKLYDLESQNAADLLRARNVLREAPGTAGDHEAIYHHLEDPAVTLNSEQRKILDGYLRPILDASERINQKLEGGKVENYVHRIPVGKGNLLDRILGGESKLSAGRGLSKSSASLKGRTMMALEDEAGNRRVVSIKGGKVTAFDQGRAEDLGRLRGLETQGVKSKGEVLDRQLEPMQRELEKLETERRTLTATKGREASAGRRIENIENREAELREALQDAYRTDEGRLLSEDELRGRVFVDKNGHEWKIKQATTKEIEANTGVRYHKNALASTVLNYLNLRKAERAYDFLESYKNSPDFQQAAVKIKGGRVPVGWQPTELPQFHGHAFEPHTAEVLDWYAKRMRAEGPNLYREIGNFLRTAIFFNPLIHTPNIGVHWIVEKGLTGVGPQNWGRILRTGSRAIDAVIHQNSDFLSALDAGAPLQSARLDSGATTKLLLERMGRELEANPTAAQKVSKALGYANPVKLIRSIYNFSGKVTWVSNDIAMLQAAYEHMEHTGSGFKEAMTDVSKHIPDYRLPTRIFNSTALAKLMSNPDLTMFGAYHYGALRSYAEMAKGLLSEDIPQAERMKGLDRLAMLGLFTFVAYPQLDKLAKLLTGDKTAQFRRAGASTFIYNLAQLAQGEKSPTQVLESVATPAVHTKALLQLAVNRDFFTGRHIVDWNADAKTIAKQLARYGGQNLAPVNQGMQVTGGRRTFGQQVAGLAGIKTKVPTPAEALARKFAAESAGAAAPDQDTLERSYLRKQFENDLRDKKITLKDLGRALTAGTITVQDAKTIVQRAVRTPLQNEFKSLPIKKALQVWGKADAQERQSLRALLISKVERINPSRYSPAELAGLRAKIIGALTNRVPTTLPSRLGFRVPFTPPNGIAGRIPLRPPVAADGQR